MRCQEIKVGPIERRQQAIAVLLNSFHESARIGGPRETNKSYADQTSPATP
jgi:hypothetical protein